MLLGLAVASATTRRGLVLLGRLLAATGGVLACASATPAPLVAAGPAAAALLAWLLLERGARAAPGPTPSAPASPGSPGAPPPASTGGEPSGAWPRVVALRLAAAAGALLLAALELPWRLAPALPPGERRVLYVLGDSLSAGMNAGETTWPRRLAVRHGRTVVDLSEAGATVATALARQVDAVRADDAPATTKLPVRGS